MSSSPYPTPGQGGTGPIPDFPDFEPKRGDFPPPAPWPLYTLDLYPLIQAAVAATAKLSRDTQISLDTTASAVLGLRIPPIACLLQIPPEVLELRALSHLIATGLLHAFPTNRLQGKGLLLFFPHESVAKE